MADKYVDFSIRIQDNGSETLKKIGVSTADLGKGIRSVKSEVDSLNAQVVNWAQCAQAFDGIGQVVQQLNGIFCDLTSAYQTQIVAETQLQTVMAQRMQATDADIASIKELCSAQQQLGVIGDEVAISGAQQMATFLTEKASLDVLIPAMNNLLAQQKELNATNQDAVGIGNMMGKALQGSTEVLQRVGISFTDAQKQVLKYGNESERAAMLVQVIRDNVGEMNAALAATDAGKQKQLENALGDVKEQLGSVVQGAMPVITIAANFTMAASGVMRFGSSIKAVIAALNIKRTALVATDVATKKLTVSTVAMTAAYTMGLSVAIYAVVKLFQSLTDSANDATDAQDTLKESTDTFNSTVSNTKSAIDMEMASLAKLIKEKGNDASMVATLNRKYGESLGYHKSAAEWYDVLITKSADYCRALGYEAQAKVVASQKAAKELELEALRKQKTALEQSGNAYKKNSGGIGNVLAPQYAGRPAETKTNEYSQLEKDIAQAESAVSQLGDTFETCMGKMQESLSSISTTNVELNAQQQSYDQLSKSIEENDKTLKSLAPEQVADIERIKTKNTELKKQREELGKILGISSAKTQGTGGKKENINIGFNVHYSEVDKLLNPDGILQKMNRDGIIIPVSFDVEENPIETDIKSPFSSVAIKSNNDYVDSLYAISNAMSSLSSATNEGASAWLSWGAGLMQSIGSAIPQIMALITAQGTAATANTAVAATGAAASVAAIPVVGWVMAGAAVAAVLASLASLPKFANGGIAYGPTLGIFGEYSGAANNPEVVAPLDRLKSLIGVTGGGIGGKVEFRLRGRSLVGSLERETKTRRRS